MRTGGLDQGVIRAIGAGAAGSWAVNNLGPRVVHRDFAPGYMIEHMAKDLGIAVRGGRWPLLPVSSSHGGSTTRSFATATSAKAPERRALEGSQVWMAVGEAGVKGEVRRGSGCPAAQRGVRAAAWSLLSRWCMVGHVMERRRVLYSLARRHR